jgi:hypothetical protein
LAEAEAEHLKQVLLQHQVKYLALVEMVYLMQYLVDQQQAQVNYLVVIIILQVAEAEDVFL